MGSKARLAKDLLPIILKDRKPGQFYVEPFVGGANMIDKVTGNRIGYDSNQWVINALEFIRDSALPTNDFEFDEDDYVACANAIRNGGELPFHEGLVGYALICFSFGAKWAGGWSRGKKSNGEPRDYVAEQYRANIKQKELLQGVRFYARSYCEIELPEKSIIYCDPPYAGTTKYKDDFDHAAFWEWCRLKTREGHSVYISEYAAPDDFRCIWQKHTTVSVSKNGKHKKSIEKLFIYDKNNITLKGIFNEKI